MNYMFVKIAVNMIGEKRGNYGIYYNEGKHMKLLTLFLIAFLWGQLSFFLFRGLGFNYIIIASLSGSLILGFYWNKIWNLFNR
jgi:hypothetical protein